MICTLFETSRPPEFADNGPINVKSGVTHVDELYVLDQNIDTALRQKNGVHLLVVFPQNSQS